MIYFCLIIVHELGHLIMALLLKWKVDRIYLYPYGGLTKFNIDLNVDIKEELLVLIMGPIFQVLATFILIMCLSNSRYIIMVINYSICLLVFNMLPIYPLDGGRLLNLLFNKFLSFRNSLLISLFISIIVLLIIIILSVKYYLRVNFISIFIVLIIKVFEEIKKIRYYCNKFILERYINDYGFKKYKIINSLKNMMRNKKHIFYLNKKYVTEKEILKKIYKKS